MELNKQQIENMISSLKLHLNINYPNVVCLKITENVGDKAYAIKFVCFNEYDLNVTLNISSDFKLEKSNVNVTSNKFSNHDQRMKQTKEKFDQFLKKSNSKKNENFLMEFFTKAMEYVEENFKKSSAARNNVEERSVLNDDADYIKKTSMKTSGEVVRRIQWDPEIKKENIVVGYLDRFVGLKECEFNTFDWGDIVLADLGALAIPEHRICYFKYKDEIIWNKNTRLDNVFGSTGSNITIYDIMMKYDKDEPKEEEKLVKTEEIEPAKAASFVQNSVINSVTEDKEKPNYLLSIPIDAPEIIENVSKIKKELLESNKELGEFIKQDQALHITLCTLKIDSEEELDKVKDIMESISDAEMFMKLTFPINLKFEGLGDFHDKVLHAKCQSKNMEKLSNLRRQFLDKFSNSSISTAGNYYEFVPHLTLFKISKSHKVISKLVNKDLLNSFEKNYFGQQNINEIHLSKLVDSPTKNSPIEYIIRTG